MTTYFTDSYQGVGAIAAAAPAPRSAPAPNVTSARPIRPRGGNQTVSYHQNPTILVARRGYSDLGEGEEPSTIDKIGDFLKGVGTGAINVYGASKQSAGAAEAYKEIALRQQAAASSSWVPYAVIGGVGLVAVLLLTRRK